jgi:hypothetical protein
MAHYALLDENNVVTQVITGLDETELIDGLDPETWYGNFRGQKCVRTSYNTQGGVSLRKDGVAFRKNYAGIGYIYDQTYDAFYVPCIYSSWVLNKETFLWEPPIPKPEPTETTPWIWDEETTSWKPFTKPSI